MINQTSQLASMEQLTALTKTTTEGYDLQMRSAAANILGRQVSWTDSAGTARSGVASGVTFATDGPVITVDGERVPLTDLAGVST
jgi:flagellar basal-body rod modification protein FlgD